MRVTLFDGPVTTYVWHLWFAWYPVRFRCEGHFRWLTIIARKYGTLPGTSKMEWHYRDADELVSNPFGDEDR